MLRVKSSRALQPGGTAIVPFDSPHRDRLIAAARPHAARIVTFGMGKGADVSAIDTMRVPTGGTFVSARVHGRELSFTIAQPGAHWVSNALAVLAAVDAAGSDLGLAGLALADMGGLPGRGNRFLAQVPGGEALVIDESYTPIRYRCARRWPCWRRRIAAASPCWAGCANWVTRARPITPGWSARSTKRAFPRHIGGRRDGTFGASA